MQILHLIEVQCLKHRSNGQSRKLALQQLQQKYDLSINELKSFAQKVDQFNKQIQQTLNQLKFKVEIYIKRIIEKKNQVKNESHYFTTLQLNQINQLEKTIDRQFEQMKLEIGTYLDHLYFQLNNLSNDFNKIKKESVEIQKMTVFNKKINFQLIQQQTYKYDQFCYAIAFNKDNTIMIAGCNDSIKVIQLKNDELRELQQLNEHTDDIFCLRFMKKTNCNKLQ